jgi:hypothetical protein
MLPFNLFLAQAFPLNVSGNAISAKKVLFREMFRLTWEKNLYDTMQDYDIPEEEDSEPAVWLPLRNGSSGPTDAGGGPQDGLPAETNGSNGGVLLSGRDPQEVVEKKAGVTTPWG